MRRIDAGAATGKHASTVTFPTDRLGNGKSCFARLEGMATGAADP